MTLLVGIKCSDGIVMAADGAATMGTLGQSTVRQPTSKLSVIDSRVVVGVTGPVGLGQRLKGEIGKAWSEKAFVGQQSWQAMTLLRERLFNSHVMGEFQAANAARSAIGPAANQSVLAGTMLAMPVSGELCLFQFDQQCAPEEATRDLPFVALGSGQALADPFLAFIRRLFWPNSQPSVTDGIFAALWTVAQACLVAPGGVAEPIEVVVLDRSGARRLGDVDLQEQREAIAAAENALRTFRSGTSADALDQPTPSVPNPR